MKVSWKTLSPEEKDYFKANWDMKRFVFVDFFTAIYVVLRCTFFVFVGLVYLIGVSLGGWLSFRFTSVWTGNFRTKEEILYNITNDNY